jgi:hypothetical protein
LGGILGCEVVEDGTTCSGGFLLVLSLFCLFVMTDKDKDKDEDYNNAKLAYEYTKIVWEKINTSYSTVTTKLTTVLGFSGLLLRFAADLSDFSWLVRVKIGICILLTGAVIFCGIGLYPLGTGGDAVNPDQYLEDTTGEIYGLSEEESYLYIARGLSYASKAIEKNRSFRLKCLSYACWCLGVAVIGFAISIVGKSLILKAV